MNSAEGGHWINAGISNSEIADKIIVTVGTVKSTSTPSTASCRSAVAPRRLYAGAR